MRSESYIRVLLDQHGPVFFAMLPLNMHSMPWTKCSLKQTLKKTFPKTALQRKKCWALFKTIACKEESKIFLC